MVASLDAQVAACRSRRLDAEYPNLWVDARYEHVREDQRVQSMAVVIAYGVQADGVCEVLGVDIGLSEDVVVWREFFQSLLARGVRGVKLVISDAHAGLKQAVKEVFLGAGWQRCRVHFMPNLLARAQVGAARPVCLAGSVGRHTHPRSCIASSIAPASVVGSIRTACRSSVRYGAIFWHMVISHLTLVLC